MKRIKTFALAALVGIALAGLAVAWAGDGHWVSSDGGHHGPHGNAMFIGGEGETFDLADLADGETRVFGTGEKQVTATRTGDAVTIERPARGDDSELRVTCTIGRDSCKVITVDGDDQKVAIMIQKTRECVDGEGDCDEAVVDLDLLGGDGAHKILVRKVVRCDDDGDCTEDVTQSGDPSGMHFIRVESMTGSGGDLTIVGDGGTWVQGDDEGPVVVLSKTADDRVVLRCPEGDTTMRVERSEAGNVYLCPKHSLPLEKVTPRGELHNFRFRKSADPDDSY